eukprot:40426-Eustigmatos_ZCMA.PRE.1
MTWSWALDVLQSLCEPRSGNDEQEDIGGHLLGYDGAAESGGFELLGYICCSLSLVSCGQDNLSQKPRSCTGLWPPMPPPACKMDDTHLNRRRTHRSDK